MKNLYESLLDDFDTLADNSGINSAREEVMKFIMDHYSPWRSFTISKEPNKDGLFEVSCSTGGDVVFRNPMRTPTLTNGLFKWTTVKGRFFAGRNKWLESLEGGPEYVGDDYVIAYNQKLTSLEGAPKTVDGDFLCFNCIKQFTEAEVKKHTKVKGKICV